MINEEEQAREQTEINKANIKLITSTLLNESVKTIETHIDSILNSDIRDFQVYNYHTDPYYWPKIILMCALIERANSNRSSNAKINKDIDKTVNKILERVGVKIKWKNPH